MNDHMIRRSTFCGVCHKRGPDVEGIRAWARCPQCNKIRDVMTAISAGGYGVIYLTPNQFRLEGGQVNNLRITGVPNGAFDLDYYPVWE